MKTDVAIIGGGPAGTTSAMFLARHGIDSIIIEKEQFPRFHIGESMTGECTRIFQTLGLEEKMLQTGHPIKLGVKVFGSQGKNTWFVPVMARDENWGMRDQYTWQVRRSELDRMMLEEAVARGATLIPGQATRPIVDDDGVVRGVQMQTEDGRLLEIESEVVLDCSGQATFLANAGVTGPKYRGNYDRQIAIFSHVAGALRDDDSSPEMGKDNTLIFYQEKYHWGWFIPVDDEVVSVGIVVPAAYFTEKKESKREFLARELKELNPELARRLPEVTFVEDVRSTVNYSYQVRDFAGPGYLCIGDAHRFIDPIFSFGLFVTMQEAIFAADAVKDYLDGVGQDSGNPFRAHQIRCERGADILEDAVDTFWEYPLAFATMVHARYREEMIDVFSGRVFERQPSQAVTAMRRLLQRERDYTADTLSTPIGSRYQPERDQIWEASTLSVE